MNWLVKFGFACALLVATSGCADKWGKTDVKPATGAPSAATVAPTNPATIMVTEGDITDRDYRTLADLEVTVNKATLFHDDPTPADVDKKLRAAAAELGADAVVLVRYGTVGVTPFSWGTLDGQGRAVKFVP